MNNVKLIQNGVNYSSGKGTLRGNSFLSQEIQFSGLIRDRTVHLDRIDHLAKGSMQRECEFI